MTIRFDDRVALVTGAGAGLGRDYALGLAARGARVVVNDYAQAPADETVALIAAAGGEALALAADVGSPEQTQAMIAATIERFGRLDILINNAGILRDRTFAKMTVEDWDAVVRVHLTGSALCTLAAWPHMREAGYGRIVFTSSSSGIYGNFGQSNYGAAKTGMIGLMNVLHLEGAKSNIRVNIIAPGAATQMTRDLLPPPVIALMDPRKVAPGVLFLVSEDAPSRAILCANAGGFSCATIVETPGIHLAGDDLTPEGVAAHWADLTDWTKAVQLTEGGQQVTKFITMAARAAGLSLG
jgi:NAD(P)-dependent dehydrogenase (short-subunit alcohol dehydrogenase family)